MARRARYSPKHSLLLAHCSRFGKSYNGKTYEGVNCAVEMVASKKCVYMGSPKRCVTNLVVAKSEKPPIYRRLKKRRR